MQRAFHKSSLSLRPTLTGVSTVREGLRITPFKRCDSQYPTQKDRPEQFTDEQRERIQKAYGSVRRFLHTPVTHIISMQMKRFRKYINDKDRLQASLWKVEDPLLDTVLMLIFGRGLAQDWILHQYLMLDSLVHLQGGTLFRAGARPLSSINKIIPFPAAIEVIAPVEDPLLDTVLMLIFGRGLAQDWILHQYLMLDSLVHLQGGTLFRAGARPLSSINKIIPFPAAIEVIAPVCSVQLVKTRCLLVILFHCIPGFKDPVPLLSSRHTAIHKGWRVNSGGFVTSEHDVKQVCIQCITICLHVAVVRLVSFTWIGLLRMNHLLLWTGSIFDNVLEREGFDCALAEQVL
ncbi:hypothetical protein SRHO_G00112800 [Serrasalmus rhombeus]